MPHRVSHPEIFVPRVSPPLCVESLPHSPLMKYAHSTTYCSTIPVSRHIPGPSNSLQVTTCESYSQWRGTLPMPTVGTVHYSTIVVQDAATSLRLGFGAGIVCPIVANTPDIDFDSITDGGFACRFSPPRSSSTFPDGTSTTTNETASSATSSPTQTGAAVGRHSSRD